MVKRTRDRRSCEKTVWRGYKLHRILRIMTIRDDCQICIGVTANLSAPLFRSLDLLSSAMSSAIGRFMKGFFGHASTTGIPSATAISEGYDLKALNYLPRPPLAPPLVPPPLALPPPLLTAPLPELTPEEGVLIAPTLDEGPL
jgi:hypothetical protein